MTTREQRIEAVNAVLRVAVKHPNLFLRGPFQELATTIRRWVPFGQMGVLTPDADPIGGSPIASAGAEDGSRYKRLYAASAAPDELKVPFGARVPTIEALDRAVYGAGLPYVCDDTALGGPFDRVTAAAGYRSYVAVPVRTAEPDPRVVAEMIVAFVGVGEARGSDLDLLQEFADVVGASFHRLLSSARERRLAMILETSSDAMLAWNIEGRITDLNEAATALCDRPRDELIGSWIGDLLDPLPDRLDGPAAVSADDRMELRVPARRVDVGEATEDVGGRRVVVAATLTEVEDDPIVRAHALLRDLTHVVVAEREAAARLARINELEEQHRTLLDNVPLVIFRLDPRTGELVYLNLHAERLLGVPTARALATPGFLRDAHEGAEGAAAFDAAVCRARAGSGPVSYEARLRRPPEDPIAVRGTVYPLLSDRAEVVAIEGVLADVSVEQSARRRLVQTDRLATLGTLAAGVAHEINNPAAFILLGLDMLDRAVSGPGVTMSDGAALAARDLFRELRDSIRRIVDIARDLRVFASPPAADGARRAIVDVVRTVESALSLTRGQILEHAELVRRLDDVPPVVMDDGRLGQVVVNLLVNAAQAIQDAMRQHGRPAGVTDQHVISVTTRAAGSAVEIEVVDTGVGVPAANQARIWAPFFTTKSPDVGTGLGLSISRDIIERAGGTLRVESPVVTDGEARCGSRFVISLPAAGPLSDAPTPTSSPLPRVPIARVRVLIVEDESPLAKALGDELGQLHDVTLAESGERALELVGSGQPFDVVLCDLRMPGIGGKGLYQVLAARDATLAAAFIFMTGAGFGGDLEGFLAGTGRPVLEKPFHADVAEAAIARLVTRRSRGVSR